MAHEMIITGWAYTPGTPHSFGSNSPGLQQIPKLDTVFSTVTGRTSCDGSNLVEVTRLSPELYVSYVIRKWFHKDFRKRLARLSKGVPFHHKHYGPCTFMLKVPASSRRPVRFQGLIIDQGNNTTVEFWETRNLRDLHSIATGYYHSLARYFGPARLLRS